jgi:hypothetical protein
MNFGTTMYTAKGQLDLNTTLKQYSGWFGGSRTR